jgi:hypothetical protein
MPDASEMQRNYREFVDLLPLTVALAGLPCSEAGKHYYSEEQIEARIFTVRHAYRAARAVAKESVRT